MTKGVWPTSLLKHMKKKEIGTNRYLNDLRIDACLKVAEELAAKQNISLEKALQLTTMALEYEPLIQQMMLKLKKEREGVKK